MQTVLQPGRWSITAKATDMTDGTTLSATVNITVAAQNTAPSVSITAPADNATFFTSDTITLSADASDNISVAQVDFFANGSILGTALFAPYNLDVTLPEGSYSITAKAADNVGLTTLSSPIHITVETAPNVPPTIFLSSDPPDGTALNAPATVTLMADAFDSDGLITQVEFLDNSGSLGIVTSAPWQITLNNLSAANHTFTARATDNNSAQSTSDPVQITVTDSRPQITSVGKNAASIEITTSTISGVTYTLEWSSDFVSWAAVDTITATGSSTTFTDSIADKHRFYRVSSN